MTLDITITPPEDTGYLISGHMPTAVLPSTVHNASPFLLKVDDVDLLTQSDGFTILRSHLAQHYTYELCDNHTPAYLEDQDRWLIVRDVLHALLVPIVELFDKACGVAAEYMRATKLEDLEYAFSGNSRSAFLWLQCFLSSEKEKDWCYTRGCPACVVDHCLNSEFSIRLLFAACLLSDCHYPFTIEGPTLPSFAFFLDSLERAVEGDELYGDEFFEQMRPKAIATRDGVEQLIYQCMDLDVALSQPSSPDPSSPDSSLPASPIVGPLGGTPGMKIKRSKMAKRQMKLKKEEEEWMQDMLLRKALDQLTIEQNLTAVPTQSLDAVLSKTIPAICVREIAPE